MVNGGGDIAVAGLPHGRPWRVGIRHPFQPTEFAAVIEVADAVATSGNYERPGELLEPSTGRAARGVVSATVVGTRLDIADALATACAVRGTALLDTIGGLPGFGGYLISEDGRCWAGGAMTFTPAVIESQPSGATEPGSAPLRGACLTQT
jgi:thiamine biosynthesis lipoprotein